MKSTSKLPAFILASTSPRRIEMLTQAGLQIRVIPPHVDETVGKGEKPRALVTRLSSMKAESVALQVRDRNAVVIAADTIVVSPRSKILNKPVDVAEARKMLAAISGRTHTVLTGYCIVHVDEGGRRHKHSRVCVTKVRMRKLSAKQIAAYVDTGEPMDKAGAYGAQGIGKALIESVTGSYANVIGLPIAQVLADLEDVFGVKLFSWKTGAAVEKSQDE